jgi:aminoglycoside/choline kinase family phosphotransferase
MSDLETLFAAWQAAEARASKPDATEAEVDEATDETNLIEEAMMRVPSITARDLALKIGVLSGFGMEEIVGQFFPGSEEFWAEIRALAGMAPIAAPSITPEERAKLEGVIAALSKRELWALLVVLEGVQNRATEG